ncbi:venom carboxylesterase-6-like [Choristoneura fumiferana]|uniref:venom carboxylesterase-6-like n=1 Tax=Choristoneura fumiferana TaxID=7141 RepID=UPI003D15A93B
MPPKSHQGWQGTYEGHIKKPTCLQYNSRGRNGEPRGLSGSEDCLYLNIFTPSLQGTAPVVVFDYNDNFRTGFNSTDTYSPDFFLEEEVIVVTVSYRVDILGYLTTEDDVIPPNAGLKDFILALEWIKENIKQFGGDPNRVTLMGSRGGAALAHTLLYSEKAKGLFSGVIMQSGTAFEAVYFSKRARQKALQLAEVFDINTDDTRHILEELQKIDAEIVFMKQVDIIDNEDMLKYQMSIFPFSPIVETDTPDAVLTALPENSKVINDVPILVGMNSREGLDLVSHYIFEPRLLEQTERDFLIHFPIRAGFRFDRNSSIYKDVEKEIIDFYLKDGTLYYGNILEYAVYVSDLLHNYALDYTVRSFSKDLSSSLFYYMFDYRGMLNENSEFMARRARNSMGNWGATVGDEICYLHLCKRIQKNYNELIKLVSEQTEIKVLKKMVRMWTNFIKTGNPTPKQKDSALKDLIWEPVNKESEDSQYLHITKKPRMKVNPLGERRIFWEQFLKKYSEMAIHGVVKDPESIHEEL